MLGQWELCAPLSEELSDCVLQRLHHYTFPPAVCFSTSTPTLVLWHAMLSDFFIVAVSAGVMWDLTEGAVGSDPPGAVLSSFPEWLSQLIFPSFSVTVALVLLLPRFP